LRLVLLRVLGPEQGPGRASPPKGARVRALPSAGAARSAPAMCR